ncbi:Uncharacterised protein [Propionibacterium australiense]|uniref:Uncharacterized protein n=1 Tax=Propionibacterium australiense TaxID=119981 RepID=A0A383S5E4_9ACTN|nr:Hypothetical protein PROPAUS_1052 [Propionibacterium australiense]VEH89153.1 Uncharacterised protein [Propionibacterium australiense]
MTVTSAWIDTDQPMTRTVPPDREAGSAYASSAICGVMPCLVM